MDCDTVASCQFHQTYRDCVEWNAASWRLQLKRALVLLFAAGGLAIALIVPGQEGSVWVVMPWVIVFAMIGLMMPQLVALRPHLQNPARLSGLTCQITDECITLSSPDDTTCHRWTDLTHYTETRHLLLLWGREAHVLLAIPKRAVFHRGDLESLRTMASQRLEPAAWVGLG
jgi:hypothetical protein